MDGVRVISSVAVFLLVLLASFSAAREERSSRTAWQVANAGQFNYLVLLKVADNPACSGSIPSQWTVLTYCASASADGDTKAYAGLGNVADATQENPAKEIQERVVKSVAAHNEQKNLKICTLNKKWELNKKVGIVDLFVQSGQGKGTCTLLGFKEDGGAHKLDGQTLGEKAVCDTSAQDTTIGVLHSKVESADLTKKELKVLDQGGPAICDNKQRGINNQFKAADATAKGGCNWFLDVAHFSPWIEKEKQAAEAAEAADGADGTGGTGGNGTASSGYSIHSHLNKYSNWKVLWFLVPTIVTFLQY